MIPDKQYPNRIYHYTHRCPECNRIVSGTGKSRCPECARAFEPTPEQRKAGYSRQLNEANAREFKRQQNEW